MKLYLVQHGEALAKDVDPARPLSAAGRSAVRTIGANFATTGLRVGAIHPHHMQPPELKQLAYQCDVVYGTTSEFGFDYLRDNMKLSTADQVQKKRDFAIVDEVDSTIIDEARTPLIISGLAHEHTPRYDMADKLARHLLGVQKEWNLVDRKVHSCLVEVSGVEGDIRNARDKSKIPALKERLEKARDRLPQLESERDRHRQYYEVELDKKKATLTHEGITEAQKVAGVGSFYVGDNIDIPHLLEQAIRAHTVYQRDRDYVVAPDDQGELSVIIVDANTGRKMIGRQWSDGLHQAVEAKESVPIKQETQTMATITIQNFFKLYGRLAGITGTADTEATEFYEIYKLDVVVIPTNVPVIRKDHNDVVFLSAKDKWDAIVDEIKTFHDVGRPVLVGTISIEKSEQLSNYLKKFGIKHNVLNAKHHEQEAEIIAQAGQREAVTIATNMAGRGTDIVLGEEVPELGGLHILGTERHESRRIDNQLRGRSGRQGDMGSSRFYLSLEDDLLRIFGSDRISGFMEKLGMENGQPIEHAMVSKAVENAQRKVEGHNFDIRKHLLEYDDVMNR